MGAVMVIARREIRRRWRTVVVLTVLVAVVGTVVLATISGARRTASALTRFNDEARSADVEFAAGATPEQIDALRRIDGAAAVGDLRAYGLLVPSAPDLLAIGAVVDGVFGVEVDRARIVAGRAPDPSVADEIAIGEALAAQLRLGPGDFLDAVSFTPDQIAAILGGADDVTTMAGPQVRLRIVGIERRPLDLGLRGASGGLLTLTPAFDREYADKIGVFGSRLRVRTVNGAADVPRVQDAARGILGDSQLTTQGLEVETEGARDAIDVLVLALWIFAGVAAIAGSVSIGFVLSREVAQSSRDHPTLRALGFTRWQRIATVTPLALLVGVGGTVLAVVGAALASPLFPFGVARRAEPDAGLHVDSLVLSLGAVACLTMLIGGTFVAALRASPATVARERRAGSRQRTSRVVEGAAMAGLPPSLTNGLRMALLPGRGKSVVPVRSTSFAAICGVVAATAVLVFVASLAHVVDTPRIYGWTWDLKVSDTTPNTPCGAPDFGVSNEPTFASISEVCLQNVNIEGRATPALAFTSLRGQRIDPAVLEGRAPVGEDEVALGSKTMRDLGKKIGDRVQMTGRSVSRDYEIVGRVVFPVLGQAQPLADGAAFTGAGYMPLFDQNLFNRYFVGRFGGGEDRAAVTDRLGAIPELGEVEGPTVPVEVDRLRQINWFPAALAALVGGLALFAVGHALVTSVRRRRGELAVLKTLGFSRRQVRATIAWQASTLATIAVAIGIPVGLVVGNLVWRRVADGLGVGSSARIPALLVIAVVPVVFVLVNAIAFWPARAAARTRPSVALRSE